jgi:16S rRNA (guanine527-N7)-methyltransferase
VSGALAQLAEGTRRVIGRSLGPGETAAFGKYLNILRKWNKAQRLIGSDDPAWIVENLFLDSLLFLAVLPGDAHAVADLGSGAGIPGIPLKIVRPDLEMRLVESRARRASFLATAIRELGMTSIAVLHGRAEDHMPELAGQFDAVVMRCAGPAAVVIDVAREMVRPGGLVIATAPPSMKIGPLVRVIPGVREGTERRFLVAQR